MFDKDKQTRMNLWQFIVIESLLTNTIKPMLFMSFEVYLKGK